MRAAPIRYSPRLELDAASTDRLIRAARDESTVSGYTHDFYRYPARFAPGLVRAAIEAFTEPGDLVLDPFVGGGTTLVEALVTGRHAIGSDISALATFVSEVKTTLYTVSELRAFQRWGERVVSRIDMAAATTASELYEEAGYLRHLDGPRTWRIRKAVAQALDSAEAFRDHRKEKLARCAVLRTAQWALDGRKKLPTVNAFRHRLREYVREMIDGASELVHAADAHETVSTICIHGPTAGLEKHDLLRSGRRPRLVVTSPPYPGVHVLYHRWQVHGGKETPAPFWIANQLDGDGAAYYTMGDRKNHVLGRYFEELREALRSVVAVCDESTTIVQVVAFSDPHTLLPRYLSVADDVGLEEHVLPTTRDVSVLRRLWRSVPNRKWYATQRGHTSGSREVVLFHRLKR